MKSSPVNRSSLVVYIILSTSISLMAQKEWTSNDGTWGTASNWDPSGAPGSGASAANNVDFGITDSSDASSITVDIDSAATSSRIRTGAGKSVTLALEAGASLSSNSKTFWQIGGAYGTGTGASHLRIQGPTTGSAHVTLYNFQLSAANGAADGNTFTITGKGLNVTGLADGSAVNNVVGRWSNGNEFTVSDGASATLHAIYVAQSAASGSAYRDNRVIVDNASLTLNGGAGNVGLLIGQAQSGTGGDSYNTGLQNNSVIVRNNGMLHITTGSQGNEAGPVTVGNNRNAHSNLLLITDNGTMKLDAENRLSVGNASATNRGGNTVQIDNGGHLITNGSIFVNHYTTTGQNDGQNRFIIGSGGTLSASGEFITSGLVRLEEGASIKAETPDGAASELEVRVEEFGVFEAAGSGLGSDVRTIIMSGGRFSVDVADSTEAVGLDLNSSLRFDEADSTLTLKLYADGEVGAIRLGIESSLSFATGTLLELSFAGSYVPQVGDEWTLFLGETSNIVGDLDFSLLPDLGESLWWDTSNLNAAGEWRVAVIPEPGSTVLLVSMGGTVALQLFRHRRRRTQLEGELA